MKVSSSVRSVCGCNGLYIAASETKDSVKIEQKIDNIAGYEMSLVKYNII